MKKHSHPSWAQQNISTIRSLLHFISNTREHVIYNLQFRAHHSRPVRILCFLLGEWFCLLFRQEHHCEWSSQSVITMLCSATPVACYLASLIPPAHLSSQMAGCPSLRNKRKKCESLNIHGIWHFFNIKSDYTIHLDLYFTTLCILLSWQTSCHKNNKAVQFEKCLYLLSLFMRCTSA